MELSYYEYSCYLKNHLRGAYNNGGSGQFLAAATVKLYIECIPTSYIAASIRAHTWDNKLPRYGEDLFMFALSLFVLLLLLPQELLSIVVVAACK